MRFVSGHKKQATSYKAACDCHNSKCDKSEFVYFLCLVTDRQIQPLIEQIRKQIPIHMQGNGYPDVFAFNK